MPEFEVGPIHPFRHSELNYLRAIKQVKDDPEPLCQIMAGCAEEGDHYCSDCGGTFCEAHAYNYICIDCDRDTSDTLGLDDE